MQMNWKPVTPKFSIGDLIHHRRFDYRGVIVDIDPEYQGTDEWYEQMAVSQPPKDAPWYHVLVDGAPYATYVAERNLEPDTEGEQIEHPALGQFFASFRDGRYRRAARPH